MKPAAGSETAVGAEMTAGSEATAVPATAKQMPEATPDGVPAGIHSRRTVIRSAGVASTAAVIGASVAVTSACGSEESEAPAEEASVSSDEVPVGSGTVVDETYVVTQPKAGEFYAFSSVCTHQGCQVRTVTEDKITCPCHSSQFSTTTGEVLGGPATEHLPEYEVTESGGTLTISET